MPQKLYNFKFMVINTLFKNKTMNQYIMTVNIRKDFLWSPKSLHGLCHNTIPPAIRQPAREKGNFSYIIV